MIQLGNQDILNALRKLNSLDAERSAKTAMSILDSLNTKLVIQKVEYEFGGYD